MTRSNYLFLNLSADKLAMMISVMQKELFSAGDVIMRAGDEGDKFYLVDTGEYDVIIRDSSQEPQVVHTYRHAGESFGELSLMYGKPRAATIKCVREGVVWTLERLAFRAILMKDKSNSSLIATLSKVEGFKQLSVPQLQRVTDACATETFEPTLDLDADAERALESHPELSLGIDCCGVCAKPEASMGDAAVECSTCRAVVYCGAKCEAADAHAHARSCALLSFAADLSDVCLLYTSPSPRDRG